MLIRPHIYRYCETRTRPGTMLETRAWRWRCSGTPSWADGYGDTPREAYLDHLSVKWTELRHSVRDRRRLRAMEKLYGRFAQSPQPIVDSVHPASKVTGRVAKIFGSVWP